MRPDTDEAVAFTASIGLPPVHLYESSDLAVLTTAPALIPLLTGRSLRLEPDGVVDLLATGYPMGRRTLYHSTTQIPPATSCRIFLGPSGGCASTTTALPQPEPAPDPPTTGSGVAAFLKAVESRDVGASILSLTAGLDTRALSAALTLLDRRLPTITLIGGARPSLDSIVARRLSSALGLTHEVVALDAAFERDLPHYAGTASLLSSGLLSVTGAHEVRFAEQVRERASARLSGIAGNQLARSGVEAIRPRSASLALLSAEFLAQARPRRSYGPLDEGLPRDPTALRTYLLTHELPHSLQGLFQIAHTYSVQQVPYADAALRRAAPTRPLDGFPDPRALTMRLRDIRHRFLGELHGTSFQVAAIHRAGPPHSTLPINWGWTARGGLSVGGALLGTRAAADALLARTTHFRSVRRVCRLEGLHDLYDVRDWISGPLRDFTYDTLQSTSLRSAGILDRATLGRLLAAGAGTPGPGYAALIACLDVALAVQWSEAHDVPARLAAFGRFGPT